MVSRQPPNICIDSKRGEHLLPHPQHARKSDQLVIMALEGGPWPVGRSIRRVASATTVTVGQGEGRRGVFVLAG
jgi:hypothetical protein